MSKPSAIILGAGVIGTACAYELSKRGFSVKLIEPDSVGAGASGASAAMLEAQLDAHRGETIFKLMKASDYLFPQLHEELKEETGIDFEWQRCGILQIAENETDAEFLQTEQKRLKRKGSPSTWKKPGDLAKELPQLKSADFGGLFFENDGQVDGKKLTEALWMGAKKNGATLHRPYKKIHLIKENDKVWVKADEETCEADFYVVAAGCWSDAVLSPLGIKLGVEPLRGQLVHFETPESVLPFPVYTRRQGYLTPKKGVTLSGSTIERVGFDSRTTPEAGQALENFAFRLVPGLKQNRVRAITAGLRPGSPDDLPLIGPLPAQENVLVATAHYRNGVLLAPITAKLIADFAEKKPVKDSIKPFLPDRVLSTSP